MIKLLKSFFVVFSAVFIAVLSTGAYFSDSESSAGNTFSAGTWYSAPDVVINEVYYDVDTTKGEVEGTNEWVEIFNNENGSVNLKNWKIKDSSATERTFTSDFIIPGKSFALITNNASTWAFWPTIPTGIAKYALGSNIGSGLNQDADSVVLKDNTNNIISQMDYTTGADGFSWQRQPVVSGSFILNSAPTPGLGI